MGIRGHRYLWLWFLSILPLLGQEVLIGENEPYQGSKVAYGKHIYQPSSRLQDQPLTLPFEDCFTSNVIDTTLWEYSVHLHIQRSATWFPPDLGVLVFDGADSSGAGYYPSIYTTYPGYRDSIVTHPIDLSGYSPGDSLYLSFYLNKAYRIDTPEANDSFLVYFKDAEGQFQPIWAVNGAFSNTDTFQYIQIPIRDSAFFHNQFQIVFKTYGNLNGRYDVWLLDCVYLNKNRSYNDRYPNDVGIQSFSSLPFSQGRAIPIRHWDGLLFPLNIRISNLSDSPYGGTFHYSVQDILHNQPFNQPSSGAQPFSLNPYTSVQLVGGISDQVSWNQEGRLQYTFFLDPATANPRNDTLLLTYSLDSVWHYDDGESEAGYGLFNKGAIAQQYVLSQPDTLTAIWIQFHPVASNYQNKPFYLAIWQGSSQPTLPTHKQFTRITFTHPNQFVRYPLTTPIPVQNAFKIGIIQVDDNPIGVGFDKDGTIPNVIFYENDNQWRVSQFRGVLMIAPELASGKKGPLVNVEAHSLDQKRFRVYPNPVRDVLTIELGPEGNQCEIQVTDLMGREIVHFAGKRKVTLSLANWPGGVYCVQIQQENAREVHYLIKVP